MRYPAGTGARHGLEEGGHPMLRIVLAGMLAVLGLTAVLAQESDPIKSRQATMKSFGAASRGPGLMLRGQQPFDLETVRAALRTFMDGSRHVPELFARPSGPGGTQTSALPVIWEKRAEFDAIFAKLEADATAALATIHDEASFKAEFPKVLGNCGTCHQTYRARQ